MKKTTIRIKDIAEKAGVSTGTVDRVLHGRGEVKPETKEKILRIVKELDYQPNLLASTLASKKKIRIAALYPQDPTGKGYWSYPMQGMQQASKETAQYGVTIENFFFDFNNPESYIEQAKVIASKDIQGLVVAPFLKRETEKVIHLFAEKKIPYVFIDTNIRGLNPLAYVGQDTFKSGRLAASLLHLCMKPEDILILNIDTDATNHNNLLQREMGFRSYFAEQGKTHPNVASIKSGETIEPALEKIMELHTDIKGIYVPNSRVWRVAKYLDKIGKSTIRLIGYDLIDQNIEWLRRGVIDFLIGQRPQEQGYQAIQILFNKIVSGSERTGNYYTPIDLINKENLDSYLNQGLQNK